MPRTAGLAGSAARRARAPSPSRRELAAARSGAAPVRPRADVPAPRRPAAAPARRCGPSCGRGCATSWPAPRSTSSCGSTPTVGGRVGATKARACAHLPGSRGSPQHARRAPRTHAAASPSSPHPPGNRAYAASVCRLLDPSGAYFGDRVIAQVAPWAVGRGRSRLVAACGGVAGPGPRPQASARWRWPRAAAAPLGAPARPSTTPVHPPTHPPTSPAPSAPLQGADRLDRMVPDQAKRLMQARRCWRAGVSGWLAAAEGPGPRVACPPARLAPPPPPPAPPRLRGHCRRAPHPTCRLVLSLASKTAFLAPAQGLDEREGITVIVDDSHSVWSQHRHNLVRGRAAFDGSGGWGGAGRAAGPAAGRHPCCPHPTPPDPLRAPLLPLLMRQVAAEHCTYSPASPHKLPLALFYPSALPTRRWRWSATSTSPPPAPRWASRAPRCSTPAGAGARACLRAGRRRQQLWTEPHAQHAPLCVPPCLLLCRSPPSQWASSLAGARRSPLQPRTPPAPDATHATPLPHAAGTRTRSAACWRWRSRCWCACTAR